MRRPAQVLLVDDDDDLRTGLRGLLQQVGYEVETARNGREALDYLSSHPAPRVILLDLMMPVMDGAEFCRVRRGDPALAGIPVFLFTARDVERAPLEGVERVFRKPVRVPDLLAALRSVVPPASPPA